MQSNVSNAQKYINHDDDEYSSENNSNISRDEMFEENTMDEEEVENIIDKLNEFKQKKKPKRPLVYVKNSKMAVGSARITNFFDAHNNSDQEDKSSGENAEINKFQNDENIRTTIESIGNLIKNEKPQKVEKGSYRARSIRRWATIFLKSEAAPQSYQEKHPSKFLLHNESPLMPKWLDKECLIRTPPILSLNQKPHILITYNELTFYAYDGMRAFWGPCGEGSLRKKGTGAGLHVSDFLTEEIGRLKDDENEARVIIALDANKDGYWNGELLLEQAFDNSTIHMAIVPDALNVKKMNMYPSGCQPKMHPTKWNGHDQEMVYPLDHPKKKLWGQAKVEHIRAYARLSFRWMDTYQHRLMGAEAEYAVRQHKSHQKLNQVLRNIN
ncbi:44601_t:CDS:2 [Gigaspora margarita]|uniref:44601_t:CDS:1 n=1 Tax=Gigaspora margarita TaxID=4874 RepID=A0ABN7VUB4_GIGMA|nr:44601_t:CDS:2 [Gigaspora margarita]